MDKTLNYIDSRAIKVTNEMKQAFVNYVKNNPNGEIDGIKLNNLDNILNPSVNTLNNDGIPTPSSQIDPSQNIQANSFIDNNQIIGNEPNNSENSTQINEISNQENNLEQNQISQENIVPDISNEQNEASIDQAQNSSQSLEYNNGQDNSSIDQTSENINTSSNETNPISEETSNIDNQSNEPIEQNNTVQSISVENTLNNDQDNSSIDQTSENIINTPADETTKANPLSEEEISNQIDDMANTSENQLPENDTVQNPNESIEQSQESVISPLSDNLNNNDQYPNETSLDQEQPLPENTSDNQNISDNIVNTPSDEATQLNSGESNQTDNSITQETSNTSENQLSENNSNETIEQNNMVQPISAENTINDNSSIDQTSENIINTPAEANPLSEEEKSNQIDDMANQETSNTSENQLSENNSDQSINETQENTESNSEDNMLFDTLPSNEENDNQEKSNGDVHIFDPTKDDPYPDKDIILPNGNGYSTDNQENTIKEVTITPLDEKTKEEYDQEKHKDDLDTTLEHEEKEPITPEVDDPYEFSLNLIDNNHEGPVGEMAAKEIWDNLAKTYDEEKTKKDMPSIPKVPVVKTHAVNKKIDIPDEAPALFTVKVHNKTSKEDNSEVKLPEVLDDDIIENERKIPLEKVKTIINKKIDPSEALDDVLKETGVTDKMFDTKKKINLKNLTLFDNYDDYIFEFAKDYYKTEAVTRKQLDYLSSVKGFLSKEEFEVKRREQYRQITVENENLKKKIQELNDNFTKKLEDINKLYDENVDKVVNETKYIRDSAEKDRIRKDQTDRLNKFLAKQVKEQVNKINSLNDNVKKLKTSNSTKSSEIKSLKRSKKKAKNKLKNLENK